MLPAPAAVGLGHGRSDEPHRRHPHTFDQLMNPTLAALHALGGSATLRRPWPRSPRTALDHLRPRLQAVRREPPHREDQLRCRPRRPPAGRGGQVEAARSGRDSLGTAGRRPSGGAARRRRPGRDHRRVWLTPLRLKMNGDELTASSLFSRSTRRGTQGSLACSGPASTPWCPSIC